MTEERGLYRGLTNYGDRDFSRYLRRTFLHSTGRAPESLERPVIGIATSASDFNPCHRAMPELVASVVRGVTAAGGLPMQFPTVSLGEGFLNPTAMMFRNLMAMDVEEMVRAQPMDAVVLVGGCDKTVPAQLMGAFSAGRPAVQLVTGPMSTGRYHGERLGACTDCRRFWANYRGGDVSAEEIAEVERNLATTAGTCAVMGTASTMACVVEALGMALPGSATAPAVHSDRLRIAEATGTAAVETAAAGRTPDQVVTPASVRNALRVLLAIGGSTNTLVHLTAMAGRLGIPIDPDELNALSETTPVLVELKPTGAHYMEDLHASGGLPAVLHELRDLLDLSAPTVTGATLGEVLGEGPDWVDRSVVRTAAEPSRDKGGLVWLRGSLAPDGALIKRSAADPALFETTGRAVVFRSLEDLAERVDDPDLDVTESDVLVLQNAGPRGAGMPEAGYLPIPAKLARKGVRDMVRISDARMSGTAYGTIVLHVTPEAAIGGPLALVRTGDRIRLSVSEASLDLLVDDAELARRQAELPSPPPAPMTGYRKLFHQHVTGADRGCDFDFCIPRA
ncbi:dihydroxy-acid dehydratase [Pseudonocardia alaniniphila]|uniref:Dihydroxy-acid dehydratase n=1 Tax=Pseudonocardia alaniniphila TaxID=75291 RepID=A0ABS9TCQ2_9PSEU|nr:dihydroxy-acid dehydratase [Pseudonocardia alaniniphila]MCH6166321.1 dihydroxy-acid dehydratase [Pseudonocardia alaniniphila]